MITFQIDGVDMPIIDERKVCLWLGEVAAAHSREIGNVSYCFCGDDEIIRANREFLGHDYYTDIITFDYSSPRRISGDMLISLDTVRTNAEAAPCDSARGASPLRNRRQGTGRKRGHGTT